MKNKNLLLRVLTCLLLIPCFIIPFVGLFTSTQTTNSTTSVLNSYGIFADYTNLGDGFKALKGVLSPFWMTLVSIMIVVLAVLALVYIILFVLDIAGAKCKALPKLTKLVGFCILASALVALISSIIAVLANNVSYTTLPNTSYAVTTTLKLIFNVGAWLLIAPTIAGALTLITPQEIKKKSKKK